MKIMLLFLRGIFYEINPFGLWQRAPNLKMTVLNPKSGMKVNNNKKENSFRTIFFSFRSWRRGVVSLPHNIIQLSLSSGSAQVQILLAACQIFAMVRISDNGPGLKYGWTPLVGQPYHKTSYHHHKEN